jgi:fructosamine-3-kinase
LDETLRSAIESDLGTTIVNARRVHGGDVAIAYALDLDDGQRAFAKTHPAAPPNFFTTEAAGLEWLRAPDVIPVPAVLAVADEPPNRLVLEWIDEGGRTTERTEAALGTALAALHAAGAPAFGREDRRTTGSRGLPNEPCATWAEFYRENRLLPLARLAREANALPTNAIAQLERVASRLEDFGAAEPPARLHGDLWAGNRLVDAHGRSWLIDPAAHGGHREFDLAMMRLFGGFGARCFSAYEEVSPLAPGWQDRVALHQIAPLVVHAIKFGGGYVASAHQAIAAYA